MEHWYILHSKPNCERRVEQSLEQQGFNVYLPQIEVVQPSRKLQQRPFFPSYLFLNIDPEQINWFQIQWTPGLYRVVAFGHQPAVVPNQVVDYIRHQVRRFNAAAQEPSASFQPGDEVIIIDGPFEGLRAIFDRSLTAKGRVQVLLTVLGRASRVHLSASDLEKVAPKPELERRTRGRGRPIHRP